VQADGTGAQIWITDRQGSKPQQLVKEYGPGKERASQPTWTAGGRIIFDHITGANDERGTVAFITADGSGPTV
jgi:hypothetical protein